MDIPMMGDFRESLGLEACERVEEYANKLPSTEFPCYIIVCAKTDRFKAGQINATIQHYKDAPPPLVGILTWYADKDKGILDFCPQYSAPPDIPLDEKTLSKDPKDSFGNISKVAKNLGIILS